MIFLDSSFLVAFAVDGDSNHPNATKAMQKVASSAYGEAVISDYVFDETVTVALVRTRDIRKARLIGESLLDSFRMLRVDESVFERAWQRFRSQRGARFSFTDSVTIELMQENGIKNLATFDEEFYSSRALTVIGPS